MTDTRHPVVGIRRQSGVATITLTNGPANALSNDVIAALDAALDEVTADGAVRAIVFASAVDGFFAAGADLKLLVSVDGAGFTDYLTRLRAVIERIGNHPCVSIAAIEGQALGGGLELALACTFRVASSTAKLGVPEIRLGLLPGAGGTQRLPHLIGRGPALELLLSGRSVSGEEAAALGLVDRVVAPDSAGSAATTLAESFAAGPRQALAEIKACVDVARDRSLADGLAFEQAAVQRLFASRDGREGVAAFIDKRPADFE